MSDFSTRQVLLAALDLPRRRPMLLVFWMLLFLLMTLEAAWVIQLRDDYMRARLLHGGLQSGRFVAPVLMLLGQGLLQLAIVSTIWTSAFAALLRPQHPAAFDFGLVRTASTVFLARLVVQVLAAIPIVILSLAMFRLPPAIAPWVTLNSPVVLFIAGCGAFWTAVASVVAFDQAKVAPFRCWASMRGHVWKLAALYGVAALILLLVKLLPSEVLAVIDLQSTGEAHLWQTAHETLGRPQASLRALATPSAMALALYNAAVSSAEVAILAGLVATAYRARPLQTDLAAADS